ncbi:MAG TPA: nucleotide exchange factor GrpE [Acidimicrobiia bacterium]|nr:nucleotide exchange factor GrpE [Acidimicrobiia bacterium]
MVGDGLGHKAHDGESDDGEPRREEPDESPADAVTPSEDEDQADADPIVVLERERDELTGVLQRVQADFENFRKRVMRDQATQVDRAHESLVEQLLPVLDSFELAVLNVPAGDVGETAQKLKKGIELVYAELLGVLEKAGLERLDPFGKPFDPEEHEAVMRDEGEGEPVVREVLRTGYRLKGRVLRPAMVRVGPAGERA